MIWPFLYGQVIERYFDFLNFWQPNTCYDILHVFGINCLHSDKVKVSVPSDSLETQHLPQIWNSFVPYIRDALNNKRPYCLPSTARLYLLNQFQNANLCDQLETHTILIFCLASEIEHLHSSLCNILHLPPNLVVPHTLHVHPAVFLNCINYKAIPAKSNFRNINLKSVSNAASFSAFSRCIAPSSNISQTLTSLQHVEESQHPPVVRNPELLYSISSINEIDQEIWTLYYCHFVSYFAYDGMIRFRIITEDLYYHDTSSEGSNSPIKMKEIYRQQLTQNRRIINSPRSIINNPQFLKGKLPTV